MNSALSKKHLIMNEYETLKTCVAEQWRNFKNFYTLEKNM